MNRSAIIIKKPKPKECTCGCGRMCYPKPGSTIVPKLAPPCQLKAALNSTPVKKNKDSKRKKAVPWKEKDKPALIEYVQSKLCNPYIRARDQQFFGKCISSGYAIENAGHYFAAGNYGALRFKVNNIHGQSIYSNKHKHGDLLNYREGLIKRHGENYVLRLEHDELMYRRSNSFSHEIYDLIMIGETFKYLLENKIWIFEQDEFDKYKDKIAKKEL